MGTYITHEGLPFHGALEKIRIRSCRVADLSLPGFDEKQLLEITLCIPMSTCRMFTRL